MVSKREVHLNRAMQVIEKASKESQCTRYIYPCKCVRVGLGVGACVLAHEWVRACVRASEGVRVVGINRVNGPPTIWEGFAKQNIKHSHARC